MEQLYPFSTNHKLMQWLNTKQNKASNLQFNLWDFSLSYLNVPLVYEPFLLGRHLYVPMICTRSPGWNRLVSNQMLKKVEVMYRAGKSGESGKLLPGKFDHLEGNYDFQDIRHSGKFVRNVNFFLGNLHFFQPWGPLTFCIMMCIFVKSFWCTCICIIIYY